MSSIQYLTFASVTALKGRPYSDAASARYRVITPAAQLGKRGHKISIGQIPHGFTGTFDPARITADITVFSKSLSPANEALAKALRERGRTVIVDQCDNYFDHAQLGTSWRDHNIAMCRLATRVVASTPTLAELVREHAGVDAMVISDPVEGPRGIPAFDPQAAAVKLLWFGHPSNWNSLAAVSPALAELAQETPLEITAVTRAIPGMADAVGAANRAYGPRLQIHWRDWNPDAVWAALKACDMVVLPSQAGDFHAAKSPNRIAESLWAGRCVVAHPIPAYQDFRDDAWIDDDMVAGIRHALGNRDETRARIARGQAHVEACHAPAAIADRWEIALGLRAEGDHDPLA